MNPICPGDDELKAFCVGDLPAGRVEEIAGHVEDCPRCDATLTRLDAHADDLVRQLNGYRPENVPAAAHAVPQPLVELAKSAGASTQTRVAAREDQQEKSADVSLDPGRRMAIKLIEQGARLGRYELEAELGVGAFGYVFRARDTELDRVVAVKVRRAGGFAGDEEVERFFREARSIAQLKHPGIVAIYDTGQTEEDVCYLVTEYVEGETLEERLRSGRVDPNSAARLVVQIAEALQYAHSHGVIHRDVKPSNVMLDDQRRPHLMDFGLAKLDAGETMTSDGRVMGTPAYMSPEQARGESHQVDARSDIYSLGVILYELLTGERPFQGNRRMLLLQVLEDPPRAPRELDERIARDLETICLKSMAKSPSRRYQSAAELADDLRRFLRGEPIRARRIGYGQRLFNWCRRYPLAASLLVAVPLGSLAGFTYLSRLSEYFVHETALHSMRMEADMLEKINSYYSEEIVARLDWNKIQVTHQYATTPHSLPLPFTFMIDAGQKISEGTSGMEVRIYSRHPWRKDGGPRDAFEEQALDELQTEMAGAGEDRSYYRFVDAGSAPVLKYARAQVMQESCVKCHNSHNDSPKKDWQVGDLAGVLAITRPLERDIQLTRSGLRSAFYVMATIAVLLTGFSLALLWAARRRVRTATGYRDAE